MMQGLKLGAIAGLSYERIVMAFRRLADDITTRNDSVTGRSVDAG